MAKRELEDRNIVRKQPKLKPLQRMFVGFSIGHTNRSKRLKVSVAPMQFTKQEKKNETL
jgi:hypothetical protein